MFIRSAQLDALNPELARVDIEYLPSGRMRHLRMPDAQALRAAQDALNGWDPTGGCIYYYNPARSTSAWIYTRTVQTVIGKHYFAK